MIEPVWGENNQNALMQRQVSPSGEGKHDEAARAITVIEKGNWTWLIVKSSNVCSSEARHDARGTVTRKPRMYCTIVGRFELKLETTS